MHVVRYTDEYSGHSMKFKHILRHRGWRNGRAGEIRTHDLLHPMQAFYQAELRPDLLAGQLELSGWGRG